MSTSLIDVALECVARGWFVLPIPRDGKRPIAGLVPNGVKDATNDPEVVRRWWTIKPDANVGVACGPSRLAVVDCDNGNETESDFDTWAFSERLLSTYTVHSGRRTNFGTHSYYTVLEETQSGTWNRNGRSGEIRSRGLYVLAAGSIHKDSKEPYEVLLDVPLAPLPEHILDWLPKKTFDMSSDGELDNLRVALERHGIDYSDENDKLYVACPWISEHSCYSGPSESALFVKNGVYCFKCHHSSCDGRGYSMYVSEVTK